MTTAAAAFLEEIMAKGLGAYLPAVAVKGVTAGRSRRRDAQALDGTASLPERKLARKNTARKGRARQLLARDYYKSLGYQVEVAYGKVLWIPTPAGKRIPIVRHHDYFGLWDLIVVGHGQRFFVQVGSVDDVSTKRRAILDAGFPTTSADVILAHEAGRRFRVYRGPTFAGGERIRAESGQWAAGDGERIEVPR